MKNTYQKIVHILASRLFFFGVMAVSILQGAWIALSSRYPMAFDEAYHYNLVRMHAEQWNPLFLSQPAGPAPYGALVRDPSWLHHYLLSFPYRLLDALGASEYVRIVSLRLINVAFFAIGLYLFRRLLLLSRASPAAVHASSLFFILVPTVPLLAGQINYDNLQFPLLAATLLATYAAAEAIRKRKPRLLTITLAFIFALLGSVNKFTFLPFLLAVVLYIGVVTVKTYRHKLSDLVKGLRQPWRLEGSWQRNSALGVLVVLSGLFVWFYGVNTVVYHNPVIQCHQVLEPSRCEGFEPWLRNYTLAQSAPSSTTNPVKFTIDWIGGMFYRSFFVINGATGPKRYTNMVPLGIAGTAALLMVVGVVLTARFASRILAKDRVLQLTLLASLVYVAALWGRNFNDFRNLGEMVAINGRYFQPILFPLILFVVASYQRALFKNPQAKFWLFIISMLGFMSGGGIIGFIHYSDVDWYFAGQAWIESMNAAARRLVAPLFLWF